MSSRLEQCPPEMLEFIINFADHPPSLAVLARTSRCLNHRVTPYLYRHITLFGRQVDRLTPHLCPITLLALQKPQLAAMVRRFTLNGVYNTSHIDNWPENKSPWKGRSHSSELDQVLRSAIDIQLGRSPETGSRPTTYDQQAESDDNGPTEDSADQWFRLVRAGVNEAAILALLLPNLINLECLDVAFIVEHDGFGKDSGEDSHFIMDMLHRAAQNTTMVQEQPILGKLSDVMLYGTGYDHPDDPAFFGACVRLPAIRNIFGYNQGNQDDAEEDPSLQTLKPGSSSVEFVHLRYSKLSMQNFSKLLQGPACLKTLIYEMGNTWAWSEVDFSEMQLILEFQKETLENLCLSHDDYLPFTEDDQAVPMSFADFSSLRRLCVAPISLYGDECLRTDYACAEHITRPQPLSQEDVEKTRMLLKEALPPQLEALALTQHYDYSMPGRLVLSFEEVLSNRAECFPHLREVSIHVHPRCIDDLHPMVTRLMRLPWKENGVRFVVGLLRESSTRWGWDGEIEWACRTSVFDRTPA